MTVRKEKNGTWTVDISDGFHPITQKESELFEKVQKQKRKL